MEHGETQRAPAAAPLVDPVRLPTIATGENWQHLLLENRFQRGGAGATQRRWVWALLLSSPEPIASFDAIADLPRGSIITALFGGEVRDLAELQAALSPSARAAIARLPNTSEPEPLTLTVRDGAVVDGMCVHLSNDPSVELRTAGTIGWEAFEDGRSRLLAGLRG